MDASADAVTSEMIAQCERLIRPFIRRTPVLEVDGAEFGLPGHTLTLKLELLQHSGSFKARGAFANLLTRDVPQAGVVAASGGNHGAAVAYAAMKLGKPAKIFVPSVSSPAKVQRIRDYGADLTIEGDRYADALAGQRGMGATNRRIAGAGLRSERNHHGTGNARPRARRARHRISIRCWYRWAAAG